MKQTALIGLAISLALIALAFAQGIARCGDLLLFDVLRERGIHARVKENRIRDRAVMFCCEREAVAVMVNIYAIT